MEVEAEVVANTDQKPLKEVLGLYPQLEIVVVWVVVVVSTAVFGYFGPQRGQSPHCVWL